MSQRYNLKTFEIKKYMYEFSSLISKIENELLSLH